MSIPILMYHQIEAPPPRGTPLRGLVVAPNSFARQMWLLRSMGYHGLCMRDLEPYLAGAKHGKVIGLTFDDGYRNNLVHALPILMRHGFTATCYAVSNMLGDTNRWDRAIGVKQIPLMNADDWGTWLAAGMEVGSHTRTHADLTQLSTMDAAQEISISKLELQDRLKCEVRHFCYPYGRFHATHCDMVRQAGYVTATTTQRGRTQSTDDPYTLRRILVAQATYLLQFGLKVTTRYEDRRG